MAGLGSRPSERSGQQVKYQDQCRCAEHKCDQDRIGLERAHVRVAPPPNASAAQMINVTCALIAKVLERRGP